MKTMLYVSLLIFFAGCGGTLHRDPAFSAAKYHYVRFDPKAPIEFQVREAQVAMLLEQRGFATTTNTGPEVLVCTCRYGGVGVAGLSAKISLKDGQKEVVSGEGGNGGWGTWVARGSAENGVFIDAMKNLCAALDGAPVSEFKPTRYGKGFDRAQ